MGWNENAVAPLIHAREKEKTDRSILKVAEKFLACLVLPLLLVLVLVNCDICWWFLMRKVGEKEWIKIFDWTNEESIERGRWYNRYNGFCNLKKGCLSTFSRLFWPLECIFQKYDVLIFCRIKFYEKLNRVIDEFLNFLRKILQFVIIFI